MPMVRNLISKFELELGSKKKTKKLHKSLKNLVVIFFAIVLGFGLDQFKYVHTFTDGYYLFMVYLAIILSWWGYNYGTVAGKTETNLLNYIIDVILLFIYWVLIWRFRDVDVVYIFIIVKFFLYFLWEGIRHLNPKTVTNVTTYKLAALENLLFTFAILGYYLFYLALDENWSRIFIASLTITTLT